MLRVCHPDVIVSCQQEAQAEERTALAAARDAAAQRGALAAAAAAADDSGAAIRGRLPELEAAKRAAAAARDFKVLVLGSLGCRLHVLGQ